MTDAEKLLLALLASSEWFTRERWRAAESYGNGTDEEHEAREYLIHHGLLERETV